MQMRRTASSPSGAFSGSLTAPPAAISTPGAFPGNFSRTERTMSPASSAGDLQSRKFGTPVGHTCSASSSFMAGVERDQLPTGVSKLVASRMRLDANMAPATLGLRMNYQNLLNEMKYNNGKIVSHQFALMQPRRKQLLERPRDLEIPAHWDKALYLKCAKRHERESRQATLRRDELRAAKPGSAARSPSNSKQHSHLGVADEAEPEGPQDPTHEEEVLELLGNQRVRNTYLALVDDEDLLPQNRIHRALEGLSFPDPDREMIKSALQELRTYTPDGMHLSYLEFCVVYHRFYSQRQEMLREQFKLLDHDQSGTISMREFRHLLWDLGYTVQLDTIKEIFMEVDEDNSGAIELNEFDCALQIVHDRHGFTKVEVQKLFDLFDRYDSDGSGEISSDELASALGWFGTPTTIAQAEAIIQKFDEDFDGNLCRPEFLLVMRARLEQEIAAIRGLFAEFDTSHTGTMSASELVQLFQKLGYTIPRYCIHEGIRELGQGNAIMGLIFEDVLSLLHIIRDREGFSRAEQQELVDVYKLFATSGQGELREFELMRTLNWLGYPISTQRRRVIWCKVDVDKSGCIDQQEFLKFVRLLREEEVEYSRQILKKHDSEKDKKLRDGELRDMLNKLGYAPAQSLVDKAVKQAAEASGDKDTLPDVLGVLSILRFIREAEVAVLRESAGLPNHVAEKVRSKFRLKIEQGKKITPAEFERFIYEIWKSARYAQRERTKVKALIESHSKGKGLELMEALWIVREYGDAREEDAWRREGDAAESAGLSSAQVAQFRHAFVQADVDGSGSLSDDEILTVFSEVMVVTGVQVGLLKREFNTLGESKAYIDFPEFLRLMGVILDEQRSGNADN